MLPLPYSALKAASGVLRNPANRHRAVPLSFEQFRYGFANAVSEEEAKELYGTFSEAKVDVHNPDRGPLLITSGEKDHQVPTAIAKASFKRQQHNSGVTEIVEIAGRGHSLTIDAQWRELADIALAFIRRFV
ncbi:MAG: hypothetical protein QOD69_927 [Solirubrobacteraceae bacterium]|nr:hypothetical protein [Solirubrobacteraceae bacterium]